MSLDWTHFSPLNAWAGGTLIGLSAAMLVLFKGRIAGISGIVGGLLQRPSSGEFGWRIAFLAGLIASPLAYGLWPAAQEIHVNNGWGTLAIAGLLVGFGARLGSGCTSGHGVCGLSRLSPRSLAATLTFMAAGVTTVFVTRHVLA